MAELYRSDICNVDISKSLVRSYAGVVLATGDDHANRFGAVLNRAGDLVELADVSVSVLGYFIRPDGETVVCNGTKDGNTVYVDLPAACYTKDGSFSLAIKVSSTEVTQTVRVIDGQIRLTQTETLIDSGDVIPSLEDLMAHIAEMEDATAEAETAAAAANEAREGIQGEIAALTEEKAGKDFVYAKSAVAHDLGDSDALAISQKAVTEIVGATKKQFVVDVENIVGYTISSTGVITAASNYAYITDYIPVSAGQVLRIAGSANWGNATYAYFDVNKSVVSVGELSQTQSARTYIDKEVVTPDGVSYIVVSGSNDIPPRVYNHTLVTLSDKHIYKATINGAGAVIVNDSLSETVCITDYIPVTVGQSYHIKGSANWSGAIYAYYDAKKALVSIGATAAGQSERTYVDDDVIIPGGAVYIVVSGTTDGLPTVVSNTEYQYEIPKRWYGKKWVCLGDSLTEKNIRTTKNYHDYVAENTGITVINMGISGTGYKRRYENSQAFYQRVQGVPADVDVVTIFGSGNDLYMYGDVLGDVTDTGTDTLCGCINTTIDNLYAVLPTVQLGIVTPTPWETYPLTSPNNIMERYSNKLIEICKRRGIPCLDLYRCSGLRPWDANFRALAYSKDDGGGTHPDETGHALIAPRFKAFLETLLL